MTTSGSIQNNSTKDFRDFITSKAINGSWRPVGGGSDFNFTLNVPSINNIFTRSIMYLNILDNRVSFKTSRTGSELISFDFTDTNEALRFYNHMRNVYILEPKLFERNALPYSYYQLYLK